MVTGDYLRFQSSRRLLPVRQRPQEGKTERLTAKITKTERLQLIPELCNRGSPSASRSGTRFCPCSTSLAYSSQLRLGSSLRSLRTSLRRWPRRCSSSPRSQQLGDDARHPWPPRRSLSSIVSLP